MDETRAEIARDFETLRRGLDQHFNPRQWLDDHPLQAVGLALAAGFYFGIR